MPNDQSSHAQHDQLLVASLAAGDLDGPERDAALSLVTACVDCARLRDDLVAIARATATLPPMARTRDFRLTETDAARLSPRGWRRFVAAFASPRLAMTRQLGIGLTTLGLAGLLFTALPSIQLGSIGSAGAAPVLSNVGAAIEQPDVAGGAGSERAHQAAPAASASAASAAPALTGRNSAGYDTMASPAATSDVMASPAASTSSDGLVALPVGGASIDRSATDKATSQIPPQVFNGVDDGQPERSSSGNFVDSDGQRLSLGLVASAIMLVAGISLLIARRLARRITSG